MWRKLAGFLSLFFSVEESIDYARQDETVRQLVEWSKSKGGLFHHNVEIRRWNRTDPTSYFGVFVNDTVKKDELLMIIPGAIKIQLHEDYWTNSSDVDDVVCYLAWHLKKEFDLGSKSTYFPYVNYLKAQAKRQIPAMWTDAGKKLLEKVQDEMELMDLDADPEPGKHFHNWIQEWYGGEYCLYDNVTHKVMDEWFISVTQQRGYDYTLIPIYDMLNHDPGNVNTITRPSIYDPDGFGVYALRDLEAGEELFYNYYDCPDCKKCDGCGTSLSYWGTPEIIRDFGFVENYPHKYHFIEKERPFALIVDQDKNDGSFKMTCENRCPPIEKIRKHYTKLLPLLESDILPLKRSLPASEYFTISMYYNALVTDFKQFLDNPSSAKVKIIKYEDDPKVVIAPHTKRTINRAEL